jgi:hypothetical protein
MLATVPDAMPLLAAPGERPALERFIAERFRLCYGARVSHFCAHLLGVRDASGRLLAAAGYTGAASGALFLEQYLERPVEELLGAAAGRAVPRERIAEVGNLAAAAAGMGRAFIPALGRHLHALGYRWVVFTATRGLRNAFRRLNLEPLLLAPALPMRLPDRGAAWGTYYAHDPSVMGGSTGACLAQ